MQLFHIFVVGLTALVTSSPTTSSASNPANPSPSPISITNVISVVEDEAKVQREKILLTTFIDQSIQNEPGLLVFELDLDRNRSQFFTYEVYKDQQAVDAHLESSYLADLLETEDKEQLKRAETEMHYLDLITRFIREPAA